MRVLELGMVDQQAAGGGTFANGYSYRRSITIGSAQVGGTVDIANFPMLFSGTYSYLADSGNGGSVQSSNGYDIIFASDTDGTVQLKHEIELYTNTSGYLVYWVKVPTLAWDADTTIYLFYGNGTATDTQDAANTFNGWYDHVFHLGGTVDSVGTIELANTGAGTVEVKNSLGIGRDFEGDADYMDLSAELAMNGDYTVQYWARQDSDNNEGIVTHKAGASQEYTFLYGGGNYTEHNNDGTRRKYYTPSDYTTLYQYHWVNESGANHSMYYNGTQSGTAAALAGTYNITRLGGYGSGYGIDGKLDELRISTGTALTDGFTTTDFNSQNNPSSFYTLGAETTA